MLDRNCRKKRAKVEVEPKTREELERLFGRVWSQQELAKEFIITSIIGLTVIVRGKDDPGTVGSLDYQNAPRLYYNYRPTQSSN
jgi:hypothetical protein